MTAEMDDLEMLFKEAENTFMLACEQLQKLYEEKGLAWSKEALKGLRGDIFCKVFGSYLERTLGVKVEYEVKLTSSGVKADMLVNHKIAIESKVMGIFSLKSLKKRYHRLADERRDLYQIIIGWQENPSYVNRIRNIKGIGSNHHFWLYNLQTHEYLPTEFERLIETIKSVGKAWK